MTTPEQDPVPAAMPPLAGRPSHLIPPDPAAVSAARMATPRASRRVAPVLGFVIVLGIATALVLPKQERMPEQQHIPVRFGEPTAYDQGFRFLVTLASPHEKSTGTELECMLVFSYVAADGDLAKARGAIARHWNDASGSLGAVIRSFTRRDFVHELERVNATLGERLGASLFPQGEGRVHTVGWSYLRFR
jgi:hypothetical protein